MNEAQAAIRILFVGLLALILFVVMVYTINQLTLLFTGTPLLTIFEDGSVQVMGRSAGCWLEMWGCSP